MVGSVCVEEEGELPLVVVEVSGRVLNFEIRSPEFNV